MKMRKLIATVLSAMLVLLSLTACQSQNSGKNESSSQTESETSADIETTAESTSPVEISDLYNFEKYESSDVFNISKVKLNEKLENTCVSYQFTYYSDGLRIRGYISIPYSLATTQKRWRIIRPQSSALCAIELLSARSTEEEAAPRARMNSAETTLTT